MVFSFSQRRFFSFLGAIVAPFMAMMFLAVQRADATSYSNMCSWMVWTSTRNTPECTANPGPMPACCPSSSTICWCYTPYAPSCPGELNGIYNYYTPCCSYVLVSNNGIPCGTCTDNCHSP